MDLLDWDEVKDLSSKHEFKILMMAACRTATTEDLRKLNALFPDIMRESVARTNSADGRIESDAQEELTEHPVQD